MNSITKVIALAFSESTLCKYAHIAFAPKRIGIGFEMAHEQSAPEPFDDDLGNSAMLWRKDAKYFVLCKAAWRVAPWIIARDRIAENNLSSFGASSHIGGFA